MSVRPVRATVAVAAIAAFISSCQSRPIVTRNEEVSPCDASTKTLSLDEVTPYGFSAAEVLPLISGRHDGTLTWNDARDLHVSLSGATTLHIDVTPHIEEMTLQTGCGTYLYIAAEISLVTDDGGIAEHRPVLFLVTSKDVEKIMLLLYASRSIWAPAGSLRVDYTGPAVWEDESLIISISFTAAGTQGEIEYFAHNSSSSVGDAATWISAIVATWVPGAAGDAATD